MFGQLSKINGKSVQIELDDILDLSKVNRLADGKKPTVELLVPDNRRISPDQRKKIWALLNDMCDYTGDVPEEWEKRFKFKTHLDLGIKPFSLSDCSMTVANYMILEILDFMFQEDIPFKTKTWDSIPNYFPKQMLAIRQRQCVICGKHADIAHYQAVGSGRNRNKINHVGMHIMTLCREHHQIQHKLGIMTFCQEYHIRPIKVTEEIARQLKLGRIDKDDELS
ncbi:hypothetical protein KBX49_07650 [Liquorilactobacillus satsumensis]|uniref:putative HNHc nuclease n=1 Tax=Liquorilactobacillus satsumensis TaxID=259059 RepID=UPI0021C2E052|nr:putative HNHc nuclease [Liquorilactobacillus satsumensis]MCP9357971.1 hypothetical protein [Liquorilactobacillus satsumensis]MCP9371788.1 hypothetical protein [Liquorilactobacillus satsumensis]